MLRMFDSWLGLTQAQDARVRRLVTALRSKAISAHDSPDRSVEETSGKNIRNTKDRLLVDVFMTAKALLASRSCRIFFRAVKQCYGAILSVSYANKYIKRSTFRLVFMNVITQATRPDGNR